MAAQFAQAAAALILDERLSYCMLFLLDGILPLHLQRTQQYNVWKAKH